MTCILLAYVHIFMYFFVSFYFTFQIKDLVKQACRAVLSLFIGFILKTNENIEIRPCKE